MHLLVHPECLVNAGPVPGDTGPALGKQWVLFSEAMCGHRVGVVDYSNLQIRYECRRSMEPMVFYS